MPGRGDGHEPAAPLVLLVLPPGARSQPARTVAQHGGTAQRCHGLDRGHPKPLGTSQGMEHGDGGCLRPDRIPLPLTIIRSSKSHRCAWSLMASEEASNFNLPILSPKSHFPPRAAASHEATGSQRSGSQGRGHPRSATPSALPPAQRAPAAPCTAVPAPAGHRHRVPGKELGLIPAGSTPAYVPRQHAWVPEGAGTPPAPAPIKPLWWKLPHLRPLPQIPSGTLSLPNPSRDRPQPPPSHERCCASAGGPGLCLQPWVGGNSIPGGPKIYRKRGKEGLDPPAPPSSAFGGPFLALLHQLKAPRLRAWAGWAGLAAARGCPGPPGPWHPGTGRTATQLPPGRR